MANRKATMTDLRMIIREFAKGTPMREIERKLNLSRTSLRTYVNGNQKCSDFGNSECSIFGIKTTVLLASAVQ